MAWFGSNAMHHCRIVRHIWDAHRRYHVDAIQKLIGTRCERNFRVERSWTFQRVDDVVLGNTVLPVSVPNQVNSLLITKQNWSTLNASHRVESIYGIAQV